MDTEKGLLESTPFKCYIFACGAIPALVAIAIYCKNRSWLEATTCFEPRCFNNLLIIYELPITLVTALLALLGIYILVFRSEQTTTQIKHSKVINTLNLYYKHKEETIKALIDAGNRLGFEFNENEGERTYKLLFPHNSPTWFLPFSDAKKDKDKDKVHLKAVFECFKLLFVNFDSTTTKIVHTNLPEDDAMNKHIRALQLLKGLGFSLPAGIPILRTYKRLMEESTKPTQKAAELENAGSLLNKIKFICLLSDEDLPPLPRYKEQVDCELRSMLDKIDQDTKINGQK
jgi:hypothetical protein